MTKFELVLTGLFIWGVLWALWSQRCDIKQLQKKFKKLVDIVKAIDEPIPEKITSLMDVDFPKWWDPDNGGIWNVDKLGNIVIVQDGCLPHRYNEDTKTWKALSEEPEFMDLISKH